MIKQFSGTIASFLLKENIIEQDDIEIYQFGIGQIIRNLIVILVISLIASIFKLWQETIFMMASFIIIRKYAGGYHADTLIRCNAITYIVYVTNMLLIQCFKGKLNIEWFVIIGLCSVLIVFVFAPVDHKNFTISDALMKKLKWKSRIVVTLIVTGNISITYISGKIDVILLSAMMGVVTASISIIIGNLKRKGELG